MARFRTGRPASNRSTLPATPLAISASDLEVIPAICGVAITLSQSRIGSLAATGSSQKTSRPAPPRCPDFSDARSAARLTNPPRATLTRHDPLGSHASSRSPNHSRPKPGLHVLPGLAKPGVSIRGRPGMCFRKTKCASSGLDAYSFGNCCVFQPPPSALINRTLASSCRRMRSMSLRWLARATVWEVTTSR
jgi:hypothetical protein